VDKCRVQNSALLPMVASLFEAENWDNTTRQSRGIQSVRDVHLSLLGCCTTDTYASMWTNDAIAIGLPNRLFVVGADRKQKVAWPPSDSRSSPPPAKRACYLCGVYQPIRAKLRGLLIGYRAHESHCLMDIFSHGTGRA